MAVETQVGSEELVPNIRGYLRLLLGGIIVEVPLMDKNGVTLAYFDARNPILRDAGAKELARLANLRAKKPKVVFAPSSKKSIEMIESACQMVDSKPTLSVFQKGDPKSPEMQQYIANAAYNVKYKPITAEDGSETVMTLSNEQAELL